MTAQCTRDEQITKSDDKPAYSGGDFYWKKRTEMAVTQGAIKTSVMHSEDSSNGN